MRSRMPIAAGRVVNAAAVWARGAAMSGLLVLTLGVGFARAQDDPGYQNLQVLPTDISREELGEIMLANLRGLGLPRRSGEGCLHCHAGSTDTPRSTWDYASDEKPAKERARVMMAMVQEINGGFLARIEDRVAPALAVSCYTCHAGRTNPTPLPELLVAEYSEGGIEALSRSYHRARERYYEADTYDFRIGTLSSVADRLTGMDQMDDAARVHELNIEFNDRPEAYGGLIRLRLFQTLQASGPGAMVERYYRLKEEHPAEAFIATAIDPLGWLLFRSEQRDAALRLFELNYEEHPTSFVSIESLAYAVFDTGDQARGLAIAQDWILEHPDHKGGRQLLKELRR